jgi:hypothetical protein
VGNGAAIGNLGGEDVNRALSTEINANGASVYMAALVNVNDAADRAGDYFWHLGDRVDAATFTLFAARVYARTVGNAVNFGLSNTGTPTYGTTNFAKNTTYLLVVKYTINNTGNDSTSLWVIPTGVPATEAAAGTPEVANTGTAGQDVIDAVALRQGTSGAGPSLTIDGIRVADSWADAVGATGGATPTPTATATPASSPTPSPTATATPSGSPTPAPGTLPKRLFTTRMSGTQEVPANNSAGRGFGRVVLNAAETQITASFYFENLSANTISGHIHGPAAPGVNAPILFDMTPPTGVTRGRVVDKVFNVTPAQVADLRAGLWYFNVHTTAFTGGEIRGQILSTTSDAPGDFNGDGKTDFSVVRKTGGAAGESQTRWFILTNEATPVESQTEFGTNTDFLTPADYDGDGKDDIAIWRSQTDNSTFFILQSSTNTLRTVRFGLPNDDPSLVQDYDGDGVDDPAIFRKAANPGEKAYFWWYGSFGVTKNVEVPVQWGSGTDDVGVPGDYNGDGKADFTVFRSTSPETPPRGVFLTHYGTGGFDAPSTADTAVRFGINSSSAADAVVPGDYDGDGKTDFAVSRFQGANIEWFYIPSSNPVGYIRTIWGKNAIDTEVQGDYDGDGKTDQAIWRASTTLLQGVYFILRSSDGGVQYQQWGRFEDVPAAIDNHQ